MIIDTLFSNGDAENEKIKQEFEQFKIDGGMAIAISAQRANKCDEEHDALVVEIESLREELNKITNCASNIERYNMFANGDHLDKCVEDDGAWVLYSSFIAAKAVWEQQLRTARAEERERCASVVDSIDPQEVSNVRYGAILIRALGDAEPQKVSEKSDLTKENEKLRAVYEVARRVLRFNGVDKERANEAVDELDDAIAAIEDLGREREVNITQQSASRLEALLPELIHSRETHVQWRDCEQIHRDRNPQIGDSAAHAKYVLDYDERIDAINEAITLLRSL